MSEHNSTALIWTTLIGAMIGAVLGAGIATLKVANVVDRTAAEVGVAAAPSSVAVTDPALVRRLAIVESRLDNVDALRREQRHLAAKVGQMLVSVEALQTMLRDTEPTPPGISTELEESITDFVEHLLSNHANRTAVATPPPPSQSGGTPPDG